MDYCRENIFNYWSCCPSINLSNYVTKNELEEALSGISGCDLTEIEETIDSMQDEIEENAANIEALQGIISSLADRVSTLENLVAQKANISDLEATEQVLAQAINVLRQELSNKADASAITEIWDAIEEISGDTPTPTPTPTPDTGETVTGKAIMYFNDGTSRELNSTGASDTFINLVDTFPDFTGQSALTKVVLGNICYGIGYEAFANCTNLTAVTLNEGLVSIGVDSFKGCSSLRELVIPSTVEHITDTFIADCNLDSITYLSSTPPDVNNNNYQGANASANIIYVPAANLSTYQSTWSDISNKIEAMI